MLINTLILFHTDPFSETDTHDEMTGPLSLSFSLFQALDFFPISSPSLWASNGTVIQNI